MFYLSIAFYLDFRFVFACKRLEAQCFAQACTVSSLSQRSSRRLGEDHSHPNLPGVIDVTFLICEGSKTRLRYVVLVSSYGVHLAVVEDFGARRAVPESMLMAWSFALLLQQTRAQIPKVN